MTNFQKKQNIVVRFIFLSAVACVVPWGIVSCGFFQAEKQREKLQDVRVGMTKEEVRSIGGDPLSKEPYSTEQVWYYYTSPKWYDGLVTKDECTPFVFDEDDILAGWGVDYLQQTCTVPDWSQKSINSALWFFD